MVSGAIYLNYKLNAFAIGAAMGSFANVAILRWPDHRSVVSPPSTCPVCSTPLAWHDNIPIFSWMALRARCRTCQTPISAQYPLIELLGGLLALWWFETLIPTPEAWHLANVVAWIHFYALSWLLLVATFTDIRTRVIPDEVSIYAVPLGLLGTWFLNHLGYMGPLAIDFSDAVVGATFTGLGLWGVAALWVRIMGEEGLAMGDVKLMALIGAWVGLTPGSLAVLLIASLAGTAMGLVQLVWSRQSLGLPFAPALALGTLCWAQWAPTLQSTFFPSWGGLGF